MSIEGIEPPTLWFVAIHSYPLSYILLGERWELNPRIELPQNSALTTWLRSPFHTVESEKSINH